MIPAYCRAVGRLVQDIETGGSLDQIGASLSAAIRQARPRNIDLQVVDGVLHIDGLAAADQQAPEITTLLTALARHQLTGLSIRMGTTPRELLQLAALLAEQVSEGEPSNILDAVERFGFWHVVLMGEIPASSTPVAAVPNALPIGTLESIDEQVATLSAELTTAIAENSAVAVAVVMSRTLRTVVLAEAAVETAKTDGGGELMVTAQAVAARWRSAFAILVIPPALALVTELLVSNAFPHEETINIIRRCGNPAVSAVMTQLTASTSVYHRRLFFNAIVEAGNGATVLTAYLGHPAWYVVRNAACLLGAMQSTEAETALVRCLTHADERVRLAVATALLQIDTPGSRRALEHIIDDSSTQVRRRVLEGLVRHDGIETSAAVLSEALDLERDPDVQLEVVSTLRAMGTPHAVRQLVRLCSPSGSSSKSNAFKRAAIEALADVRPTAAAPLLRLRVHDRDPEIREHAVALLARPAA